MKKSILLALSLLIISGTNTAASAQNKAAEALALYKQKQYSAAADAFEKLLKTEKPAARLYYYAALANRDADRKARAVQIFNYIVSNFPTTEEALHSGTMLNNLTGGAKLNSAEKTAAVGEGRPGSTGTGSRANLGSGTGLYPFTPEDIAREGANGIDQSNFENCWFQASMSALAQLPRGQRLLSTMIRRGEGTSYIVRFPGDGNEYVVSRKEARLAGITDTAVWASLLEYAQTKKFPDNKGAEGTDGDQSRLEVGLGCITGRKAEFLDPGHASASELASFIGGAVRSQNPIVCGTYPASMLDKYPPLVIDQHAYTIIGFDPAHNLITIRNPHGRGSRRFSLKSDPQHLKFEQLEDGCFKMHVELFQQYFYSVARSFI
ncbi:MAG TPA: C2 family cysteine protease [Candidatus Obscuribacter sp.]|nr:C2 family cysteine protease [Candidatus Obscuribacter sp.]